MCTNCAPLATDLLLFFYQRDLVLFVSYTCYNNEADLIEDTSRYLHVDDLLILIILISNKW